MLCQLCTARGKNWEGDAPQCGFIDYQFSPTNWMCATLAELRDLVDEYSDAFAGDAKVMCVYDGDNKSSRVILEGVKMPRSPANGMLVEWYKNRGRTDNIHIIRQSGAIVIPTEDDVLTVIAYLRG